MLFDRGKRAFEATVNLHFADLFRFAYWLCRDHWLAEELVQETLLRAWRGWPQLRDTGAFKAWTFTILGNEFRRRLARPKTESLDADAPLEELEVDADPARAIDLDTALRTLPESSREALLMQVLGGLTCAEIAAALGSSPGAVMTRLARARQALRRRLGPADAPGEVKRA